MRIKVLGSAAGGGFPQWNCGCSNCHRARRGLFSFRPRTQAQVAVSPAPATWFLLNASPDLRQQLLQDPEFAPAEGYAWHAHLRPHPDERRRGWRDGPASSARVPASANLCDAIRAPRPDRGKFSFPQPRAIRASGPVGALPLDRRRSRFIRARADAKSTLTCKAVPLGGDYPDYVSAGLRKNLAKEEAVIGLEFLQDDKKFFYAPSLSGHERSVEMPREGKRSRPARRHILDRQRAD